MAETYHVTGLMSGTSLDGVDIAHCIFYKANDKWAFNINKAVTIKYDEDWKNKLAGLETQSALTFAHTHVEYGHYLGKLVNDFIEQNNLKTDFVSSHGHTIFHQPENKLTFQIGSGAAIAAECSLPVVCDFRSIDIALNGQGAPLVPIGDKLLFPEYDVCLNLGGFANISYNEKGKRIAFDVCPVNIVLNELASEAGKEYDNKGEMAKNGIPDNSLIKDLDKLDFYQKNNPKSLGKEWVIRYFNPFLQKYPISLQDKIRTVTEHIAGQISKVVKDSSAKKILISGGGAYNDFLINRIKALSGKEIIIPSKDIIEYKEALIFAFLGVLRMRKEINCLKAVTGAKSDNIGGAVYRPLTII